MIDNILPVEAIIFINSNIFDLIISILKIFLVTLSFIVNHYYSFIYEIILFIVFF